MIATNLATSSQACREDRGQPVVEIEQVGPPGILLVTFPDQSRYRYTLVHPVTIGLMIDQPDKRGCLFNRLVRFTRTPYQRL